MAVKLEISHGIKQFNTFWLIIIWAKYKNDVGNVEFQSILCSVETDL